MAITKDNVIGEVITAHPELIETFNRVKDFNRAVIVHVITE